MLNEISQAKKVNYHMVSLTWSVRNNMEDIRRRKEKVNWGTLEGEMNHERLWTPRNRVRVLEGRGMGEPGGGY